MKNFPFHEAPCQLNRNFTDQHHYHLKISSKIRQKFEDVASRDFVSKIMTEP